MSRLWRDQIQVFLAPERVNIVRFLRGLKLVQTAKVTMLCKRTPGMPVWQAALQQLEKNLSSAVGTELKITLSNHFVRYVILPPQAEISSPEEVKFYANFRIREIYAGRADSWVISISEWNPINGAICAAISRDLIKGIEEMAIRYQCKIKYIEPYLASVYDKWHKLLNGTRVYFAVIESGRMCIALLTGGTWHTIRNQQILHSVANEFLVALDQEAIFFGNKETVELVHVFAPEHPDLILPKDCGWRIVQLPIQQIPMLAHYPSVIANQSEINQCLA